MQTNNWPDYVTRERLDHFIEEALKEDVGDGDHSTLAIISNGDNKRARLIVKQEGILAGVDFAAYLLNYYDKHLNFNQIMKDGDMMKVGDIAFTIEGLTHSILTPERLLLNCMQRMSGIATLTHQMAQEIMHTKARLLDTRKTTPNFRMLEKWAVTIGGGYNHRFGLYDMIMLKDNHVDYAGGIAKAVEQTRTYLYDNQLNLKIEVETRNLKEVKEAIAVKPDRIMLDNFSIEDMRKAVELINGQVETEASGGITLETLKEVAETGVNYISSGAIIHSANNIDLSLKAF
ncbi:carboxylating nicotinate-nucleotide diphosphorylase [Flavobacteriaceae bacterium Ap0902]|nr:carboxylating nicotinate-nucleotide diphosphorylase [Flavobacteriaceae bacterium Ap0902]